MGAADGERLGLPESLRGDHPQTLRGLLGRGVVIQQAPLTVADVLLLVDEAVEQRMKGGRPRIVGIRQGRELCRRQTSVCTGGDERKYWSRRAGGSAGLPPPQASAGVGFCLGPASEGVT